MLKNPFCIFCVNILLLLFLDCAMTCKTVTPPFPPPPHNRIKYISICYFPSNHSTTIVIFGRFLSLNVPVFPRECFENNIAYGYICLPFRVILWHGCVVIVVFESIFFFIKTFANTGDTSGGGKNLDNCMHTLPTTDDLSRRLMKILTLSRFHSILSRTRTVRTNSAFVIT